MVIRSTHLQLLCVGFAPTSPSSRLTIGCNPFQSQLIHSIPRALKLPQTAQQSFLITSSMTICCIQATVITEIALISNK